MNNEKIITLEEKITMLEYNHDKLDNVVIAQQQQIATLEKAIKHLNKELQQMALNQPNDISSTDLPPHY